MYNYSGVSAYKHGLSVIVGVAAVAVVGFFPSGVWLQTCVAVRAGLAFERCAGTRWEGPTGVT